MKHHLMTMPINSITPRYHGLITIDDNNYVQDDDENGGTPVEDYGCFYYTPEN